MTWMTGSDDPILEFLDEHDIAVPPLVISHNVDGLSYPTVQRRAAKLVRAGLLRRHDDPQGYLEITDLGRAYLRGTVEAEDLNDALEE